MPLYEYQCQACEKTVEVLVRGAEQPGQCPECGSDQLQRLLSVPAAPAVRGGGSLPMAGGGGDSCGAPRCCGGGCQW